MIGPSPGGPGSTKVLGENLRPEPGLTRARTDSQHVREPSLPFAFNTCPRTWGLPAPWLGQLLCLASGLSGAPEDTLRGTNLYRDLRDTLLVGGFAGLTLTSYPCFGCMGIHSYY